MLNKYYKIIQIKHKMMISKNNKDEKLFNNNNKKNTIINIISKFTH